MDQSQRLRRLPKKRRLSLAQHRCARCGIVLGRGLFWHPPVPGFSGIWCKNCGPRTALGDIEIGDWMGRIGPAKRPRKDPPPNS